MYKHRIQQLAHAILACYLGMTAACSAPVQETYREVQWPQPATTDAGTPSPWHFGEVVAVATTAQGTILVFHRGALPIMEFDVSGNFIRSLGGVSISGGKVTAVAPENRAPGGSGYTAVYGPAGCYSCGAHSIRVDQAGYIWIVDATAHAVYKTDSNGNVLMQLGEVGVSGTDASHFNLPTDVAFGPDGTIYVSDGYAGARIVKFSSEGGFLLDWGSRGTGPGEFGLPHNLVVDGEGQVYVTDRDNQRIQVFDSNGNVSRRVGGSGRHLHVVHDGRPEDLGRRRAPQPRRQCCRQAAG